MKKLLTTAIILSMVLMSSITAHANILKSKVTVQETFTEQNIFYAYAIDPNGENWILEVDEDCTAGQNLIIWYDDNNTSFLYDDETIYTMSESLYNMLMQ